MLVVVVLVAALLSAACGFTARRAFDRGTKLYEKGQYAEASIEFRRAIQKDPKFGDAYLKLGLTELRQASPLAAADALRHAVALIPIARSLKPNWPSSISIATWVIRATSRDFINKRLSSPPSY